LKANIAHTKVFATLGNETRLRCLYLAAKHGEVCVCEAVDSLGISQPTASKAFRALKDAGLVDDRREANWTFYRLSPRMAKWARSVIYIAIRELEQDCSFAADNQRFEQSRARSQPGARADDMAC
jgi:ArsR family transcriptional regulator